MSNPIKLDGRKILGKTLDNKKQTGGKPIGVKPE